MKYQAKLKKYRDDKTSVFEFYDDLNKERINTLYSGDIRNVEVEITFHDPRRFDSKQRGLYRALLNDIYNATGQDTNSLHDYFKEEYIIKYERLISTADTSSTTVSEMNELIEIVLDFMFEYNVPFKKGYEMLPTNESFYLYQCCKHRKCCVCGKNADIHHLDAVGNRKRKQVDHRQFRMMALCRTHHNEIHQLGDVFLDKYKVDGIKLDGDTLIRLGLMNRKQVMEMERNDND